MLYVCKLLMYIRGDTLWTSGNGTHKLDDSPGKLDSPSEPVGVFTCRWRCIGSRCLSGVACRGSDQTKLTFQIGCRRCNTPPVRGTQILSVNPRHHARHRDQHRRSDWIVPYRQLSMHQKMHCDGSGERKLRCCGTTAGRLSFVPALLTTRLPRIAVVNCFGSRTVSPLRKDRFVSYHHTTTKQHGQVSNALLW